MTGLHPIDSYQQADLAQRAGVGAILSCCVGVAVWSSTCFGSFPLFLRPFAAGISASCAGMAISLNRVSKEARRRLGDDRVISREQRQAHHLVGLQPPQGARYQELIQELASQSPSTLQLADLREVVKARHLFIAGNTGAGKTMLAQWIASLFHTPDIKVYDSDAAPHEWPGLEVVGRQADYQGIELAMQMDLEEMQLRTRQRGAGERTEFPQMVRIIEEYPTAADEVDIANQWLKALLRRGRKYGIMVILLSQQDNVEALKLKGQGDIRQCFSYVRLGKFALDRLAAIRRNLSQQEFLELQEFLRSQERPCMVEDSPAIVPNLNQFVSAQVLPQSANWVQWSGYQSAAPQDAPRPAPSAPLRHQDSPAAPLSREVLFTPGISPEEENRVLTLWASGEQRQAEIISRVWGVSKSGTSPTWQLARAKLDEILQANDEQAPWHQG